MTDDYKKRFNALVSAIVAHVPASASELVRQFVAGYFHKMPLMDLEQLDAKGACEAAIKSFEFFDQKPQKLQIRHADISSNLRGIASPRFVLEVHNDDMPFILDSLIAELTRLGFHIYDAIHPIFYLKRHKDGSLKQLVTIDDHGDVPSGTIAESFIHFELTALPEGLSTEKLLSDLTRMLQSVEMVVQDWKPMSARAHEVAKQISKLSKHFDADEIKEAQDFLKWLSERNFVFLGYVEYRFSQADGQTQVVAEDGSQLGIFRMDDTEHKPQGLHAVAPEMLRIHEASQLVEVTKSNRKSWVHRPVLMDYISIKRLDASGNIIGECRFLGLFTSTVYYQSADRIPFIRRKIARTLTRANFDPMSYNGKALKAILEFYPRDELFQISEDDLFHFSIGLMSLEARPEVKLFARQDRYARFMSCMVYIPRDRFSSYLRNQIRLILESAYNGKMTAFYTQLTDSPLARLHVIIATKAGHIPERNARDIEAQIARVTNQWADSLRTALDTHHEPHEADRLHHVFCDAFSDAYIQMNDATDALHDIQKIQDCVSSDGLAVALFRRKDDTANHFHLKIYTYQTKRALSDMLPILENLGCRVIEVNPFTITPKWDSGDILIRDFLLEISSSQHAQIDAAIPYYEETLVHIWQGRVANDAFNALVLASRLSWREIEIIRAFAHYLRQIGFSYSQHYMAEVLLKHPFIARQLVEVFIEKFSPERDTRRDDSRLRGMLIELDHALDNVSNLSEDRVIRRFIDLIVAALRTNYFQTTADGAPKPYVSIKFRSRDIPELPKPVPFAEIFVYSLRMEGIHLRGGEVARGGLRWSDRMEDYRTEILGLVKAQMVKNAVIVPQGAKGGFVLKNPPPAEAGRDALQQEGIACYQEFLRGLLDITDNIVGDTVVPPANVVRYDDDDPYLVVAADKGTATFSDIANALALEYDFWLGDAFASGGSAGYDHKVMAITAKGAWVSVERHFAELGMNIRQQDFTVVGIGDMSGDVFGNGMLLSEHIQLIAAFNHKHIFLDPNPDAAKSFAERTRLFDLPRSQWSDYDASLISKGGGVFSRDQKVIPLSEEIRAALVIHDSQLSPEMLIQAILKAPVDLLWNGGIGTYVKASTESHEEVGDRSNNPLRVNGNELRCKVVGEGGNLGFTQRGRIEYALTGGRLNTDAIDNSAGVDCSDHEVNIKIALGKAASSGTLAIEARNRLLESMTDEVTRLVLVDNRLQTQALTIAHNQGAALLEPLARLMHTLEQEEFLDRAVEFLPSPKQISELRAKKQGLTRPELAVLLSYAKLALYRDLKASSLASSDYFNHDLLRYFPIQMQEPFKDDILSHRLRADMVATIITNSMVNRAGIAFAHSIAEETGMHPCDIARAYVITRDAFGLRNLWAEIEALDGTISAATQSKMFADISQLMEHCVLWFLENCPEPLNIEAIMANFAPAITIFMGCFESQLSQTLEKAYLNQTSKLVQADVPSALAKRIASLEVLASACDVVQVANHFKISVQVAGSVYFELGARLRLGWLRRCAGVALSDGYWDQLAVKSLIRELYRHQRRLTAKVLETRCTDDTTCHISVDAWQAQHSKEMERYQRFIDDLKSHESIDLSMLIVATRNVESICAL